MPIKGFRSNKCGFLTLEEIKQHRADGKSWYVICDFCGVARSSFSKFLKRYGLSDGKKYSHIKREYKDTGIAQELARRDGYENLTDAIRALRLSGKTFAEVEEHFKGHGGLVRKHYPKNIKVHIVTPAVIANAIEQAYKNHKNRKGHPWDTSGAYYTPKRLIEWVCPTPLEVSTGTGNFLKQAADGLNKDELQNPPYNTA